MELPTYIFIGRSGCGKGTQAALLSDELKKRAPEREMLYLQTGALIRDFKAGENYSARRMNDIYMTGGRQPSFVAVNMWSNFFFKHIDDAKPQMLIADGTPRTLAEAEMLHRAFDWFYDIPEPTVIYLNVSNEWAIERLLGRGRMDDNKQDVAERLKWFETDVLPAVQYYRDNKYYRFFEVSGERSIEDIHQDIISRVFS
ncbi:MAG: hypothetical protein COW88_02470 [Candidatus Lloydbacteria bacterium CG22_combo_CG10-13_8_21_14_all_47_15]|uniref:Adenylate kinase n=1 Tax=Candidatus Lloydbacteria bacterium CG22_combo_CG10-13_8_21_14_all_47_15 TaxID=1974635 RepID=A0A2H0CTQ3_9BACT|nr:MAG: hypothetical protein COW88_02470 [Candidatus Lloydbacteria bacterium CG22_combo_CG10-13_8_21_14_all_47_15]